MIPVLKKTSRRKFSELRTRAVKILLRVLKRRMKIMQENSREEQFGFINGKGTMYAIGILRMIGERYVGRGKGICLCLQGLEKACKNF